LLAIVIAASSCKKSLPENVEEPISRQEIVEWFEGYRQKMPGAPEPVWSSAKKTFDKDLMVVRIPLESGGGEIFFGKKLYGNNLEVKFYRQVGTFDSISKNFSGYSETIDMGNYEYHKLDFINGVKVKELRSKSVNLSDDTKSGTTTFDDRPSWLSAFWDCLKLYILSVPKWDSKENEWKCSCFCSDGSSPKKLEDPLSPGGGFIFPPTFFFPPTNLIPPRVWDPFPINPGGVGPGGSGLSFGTSSYSAFNRTDIDYGTGDDNNNTRGNYDNTSYSDYDDQTQPWPIIQNVIPISDFVGWDRDSHPSWECMDYAKAQIAKKGYAISNYFDAGQTIQIYTAANGFNKSAAKNAVGYLISALQRGIPVIVGVDDQPGSPNPNTDNTTDHFIVIVGTGIDINGTYFTFYDNASFYPTQGASINNKLYYNPSNGLITGKSQTAYANDPKLYDYIVTQIRKSKSK
jgi:hypothetical protein